MWVFLDQGLNLCSLNWQVDFQLLDHLGSPLESYSCWLYPEGKFFRSHWRKSGSSKKLSYILVLGPVASEFEIPLVSVALWEALDQLQEKLSVAPILNSILPLPWICISILFASGSMIAVFPIFYPCDNFSWFLTRLGQGDEVCYLQSRIWLYVYIAPLLLALVMNSYMGAPFHSCCHFPE